MKRFFENLSKFILFIVLIAFFVIVASTIIVDNTFLFFATFLFMLVLTLVFYFVERSAKKKHLKKLPKLFFSPLLGFRYKDDRLCDTDFSYLIETLDKYNSTMTSFFEDYSRKNNEARQILATMPINTEDRTINYNVIRDNINPINLMIITSHNLKVISNDFKENLKISRQRSRIINDQQRYFYLKDMHSYIKDYKYTYLKLQFMLKEVLEAAKISSYENEFIDNLEKIGNSLSNSLINEYKKGGIYGLKKILDNINTIMYGIYYIAPINRYSLPVLSKYLISLKDIGDIELSGKSDLISELTLAAVTDIYFSLGNLKDYLLEKSLKEKVELISISYITLFLNEEIFYIEDDKTYQFLTLKLAKRLIDIYTSSNTIKDFKKELLKNIKHLQLKRKYKKELIEFIKYKDEGKVLIVGINRLNLNTDNVLKELINNNYKSLRKISTLNRKEIIANYLQILQTFEKIKNENIFKISSPSKKYSQIIKEFIEDKMLNALNKESFVKKGQYLDTIKLELLSSENEFINKKYGEELKQLINMKF